MEELTELTNTNRATMESNGWIFGDKNSDFGTGNSGSCTSGDGRVYTWGSGNDIGSISASLQGCGTGTLSVQNCYTGGTVRAFLNDALLGTATAGVTLTETFTFKNNDVIKVTEDFAVMQLINAEFTCGYLFMFHIQNVAHIIFYGKRNEYIPISINATYFYRLRLVSNNFNYRYNHPYR